MKKSTLFDHWHSKFSNQPPFEDLKHVMFFQDVFSLQHSPHRLSEGATAVFTGADGQVLVYALLPGILPMPWMLQMYKFVCHFDKGSSYNDL